MQPMVHAPSHFVGNVYATPQGLFCVDPRDQVVAQSLVQEGSFGLDEIARMEKLIAPDQSMLMLGPHIGALAVPLSKKVRNLVVVEANPHTYRLLSINKVLNDCKNMEIHHAAANHEDGEMDFVVNVVNSGGSKRMPLHRDHVYFYDNPQIVKVPAVRMDTLLKDRTFDLIFMDIEGSEYFAMRGMPELLSRAKVLITEYLPHHLARVGGITVRDFLSPLREFELLYIPSLMAKYEAHEFETILTEMFVRGFGDEGIVFFKDKNFPRFEQAPAKPTPPPGNG